MILYAALVAFTSMSSTVRVSPVAFGKWADSFEVSNSTVRIIVVPQIGRVIHYGFVGEQNLLFDQTANPVPVGDWINYGGDKVWIAPQSLWGWPPDLDLDGPAYEGKAISDGVELRSPLSRKYGIRITRTIHLSPKGTKVTFENHFFKETGEPVRVAPWQVTQVIQPEWAELEITPRAGMPTGLFTYEHTIDPQFQTLSAGHLRAKCDPHHPYKFGAAGASGRIRSLVHGIYFDCTSPYQEKGEYCDSGSAQQLFTSELPTTNIEMEHTAPLKTMKVGDRASQTVYWTLERKRS